LVESGEFTKPEQNRINEVDLVESGEFTKPALVVEESK